MADLGQKSLPTEASLKNNLDNTVKAALKAQGINNESDLATTLKTYTEAFRSQFSALMPLDLQNSIGDKDLVIFFKELSQAQNPNTYLASFTNLSGDQREALIKLEKASRDIRETIARTEQANTQSGLNIASKEKTKEDEGLVRQQQGISLDTYNDTKAGITLWNKQNSNRAIDSYKEFLKQWRAEIDKGGVPGGKQFLKDLGFGDVAILAWEKTETEALDIQMKQLNIAMTRASIMVAWGVLAALGIHVPMPTWLTEAVGSGRKESADAMVSGRTESAVKAESAEEQAKKFKDILDGIKSGLEKANSKIKFSHTTNTDGSVKLSFSGLTYAQVKIMGDKAKEIGIKGKDTLDKATKTYTAEFNITPDDILKNSDALNKIADAMKAPSAPPPPRVEKTEPTKAKPLSDEEKNRINEQLTDNHKAAKALDQLMKRSHMAGLKATGIFTKTYTIDSSTVQALQGKLAVKKTGYFDESTIKALEKKIPKAFKKDEKPDMKGLVVSLERLSGETGILNSLSLEN